jgi:eukaryotic-like serine/threonine-protein kinase
VHRDVKPDNFLLDHNGEIYLADFDIVKIVTGGASGGTGMWIAGTPAYMAPEQVEGGNPVGPQTDVYALGISLYEMLAGKKPYDDAVPNPSDDETGLRTCAASAQCVRESAAWH